MPSQELCKTFPVIAFDSLGVEESESSDLARFPSIDALTSSTTELTQPIPSAVEANKPLTNPMDSVLTEEILDFGF